MPWPLSQDYNEAIQTPSQCFVDAELQAGEAVTDTLGLPVPCSGNFADVYAVVSGQRKWAVKCFTRQIPGLRERYAEISKYLPRVQLPFMVDFKFFDQGIRVRGQWYPILKMQWVEGLALNTFVRTNLENPAILQAVCQIWLKLATRLREANLAHGDLQHGNVLLVSGTKAGTVGVKLVDYDGMCVPALDQLKATEVGHPAYQHPQRLREGTYDLQIDRFSHLVIYTAIRSLAVGGRKLWERFDNGDNLLFTQKDFESPNQSAVFKELQASSDPEVRKLAEALVEAGRLPVNKTPSIHDLVTGASSGSTNTESAPAPPRRQTEVKTPKPAIIVAPSRDAGRQQQGRGRVVVTAVIASVVAALLIGGVGTFILIAGSKAEQGKRPDEPAIPQGKLPRDKENVKDRSTQLVANGDKPAVAKKASLLFVSSEETNNVLCFNAKSGQIMRAFIFPGAGGLKNPLYLAVHQEYVYIVSQNTDCILRASIKEMQVETFISSKKAELSGPCGIAFGLDGNLYVSSRGDRSIKRYNGKTGSFIDNVVPSGAGGLNNPMGLTFGPDKKLYIADGATHNVLCCDVENGKSLSTFVSAKSGGLDYPTALSFGPDGNLYVCSTNINSILRYNGHTGAFMNVFVQPGAGGLKEPYGFDFGPDDNLYVGCISHNVLRYNGKTGAFIDVFVAPGSGGLHRPIGLLFTPDFR